MHRWVGLGIIADTLLTIAHASTGRPAVSATA